MQFPASTQASVNLATDTVAVEAANSQSAAPPLQAIEKAGYRVPQQEMVAGSQRHDVRIVRRPRRKSVA
jgi:hypothetical protein